MSSFWTEKLAACKTLAPVYNFVGGRHTAFALFFAGTGFYLAWAGKLTGEYVALITALQALILGHSIKEDYAARRDDDDGGEDKK
jgi:hypothetical protein